MASFWERLSMATQAFIRAYSDPGGEQARASFASRASQYEYYWQWYSNSVYEDLGVWGAYKNRYRLYRYLRGLYNPAARLVDFYVGAVYPGRLQYDPGAPLSGTRNAVPFGADIPPLLHSAIGQVWQWSNWQQGQALMVRYGAALGDVFVEVVDDLDRRKVLLNVCWPGWLDDVVLDNTGNVKAYTLSYQAQDEDGKSYHYRKTVTGETITEYHGKKLQNETPNPYGFAPGVWIKHRDEGGDHGAPAYRHIGKWDELNSLAAHLHDQDHKLMAAPVIIGGSGGVTKLYGAAKGANTADLTVPEQGQESLNVLKGPADTSVQTITMDVSAVLAHMQQLIGEIEADHPELTMYRALRDMSSVTGPAAQRLVGDVAGLVDSAQAAYDTQSTKLFQMAVAIAGWRANSGAWGALDRQQRKFTPFGLDSYTRGDLDLTILARPLIALTEGEQIQAERDKLALEMDKQGSIQPLAIERRIQDAAAA